ncbi:LuxR C-terminal-related transcriptional regulator [Oryzobacter telluris]|uniref:helix-turn-helix transcriptional regulator n=1 Tax=Oryzobacter telluris TaxID=3149179 RepID=UPI00370DC979
MTPAPDPLADETGDTSDNARAFFAWVHGLIAAGDPRVRELGQVDAALRGGAVRAAAQVRRSVWHMTILPSWATVRAAQPFAALRHRPGVDLRYLTTPLSVHNLPLLASHHHPYLRVGHVVDSMLLLDGARVFVGQPHATTPVASVYESTDASLVARAVRVYDAGWRVSKAVLDEQQEPPFTRRMVQIAFHLTSGASDREIARALLVSERTVSADVAEIVRRLGARSRTQAIGIITGAQY